MKAMSSALLYSFAQTCLSQGVDEYALLKLIPGGSPALNATGRQTAIIWDIGTADAATAHHMQLGRRLNWDPAHNASAVHFCHEAPIYAGVYEDVFQCPVLFSQKQNAIILSTKTFLAPLAQPNDNLLHEMCLRLDKALLNLENPTTIVAGVSQYLRNVLSLGAPTLAQTAQKLGLSERSLRRRLTESRTCFRVLLAQTRRELCQDFLQNQSLSFTKIGERLGYSEQSAFNRAFKNWYGLTPKRYAKKLQAFDKIMDCF